MSERSIWKMLHLLNRSAQGKLSGAELKAAGIDCYTDTIGVLLQNGVVLKDPPYNPYQFSDDPKDNYWLSPVAVCLLNECLVANKRWGGKDMIVDAPQVFVIMPFSADWSNDVEKLMIEPAVKGAGLDYVRGDTAPRVADLNTNIWNEILEAGLIIAEVSEPNPNVYYELGLAHAVGKPAFLLVQKGEKAPIKLGSRYNYQRDFAKGSPLPADFGGAHYYEYDRGKLERESEKLGEVLKKWADEYHAAGVKALLR